MALQRSFEELGVPLSAVTFCVVDLETTGGSPYDDAITEVGAVKVRCGEIEGTFQTLVDPGRPVPAFVRLLTGITEELLEGAPPIRAVLPSLLEFSRDTVLVAHNARFDVGFLNAALARYDYPRLQQRVVDTALLARKVLAGEVPNRKLDTLARHLRCAHQPTHRAFADVLATIDVLHALIERLSGFGVTTLEDLVAMSFTKIDGTFSKIGLADDLPRGPGVYRFLGPRGEILYVGKAASVRTRVRSYFYGDSRRRMRDLMRETQGVAADAHASVVEAEVAEARAIAAEAPPYNRAGKGGQPWYLKVAPSGARARVSAVRRPKDDGGVYLGPFPRARMVRELVHHTRRSTPAEIAAGIRSDPSVVADPIAARLARLAREERFEEAAELRRSAEILERAVWLRARIGALAAAGDLVVAQGSRALLVRGGGLAGAADIVGGDESAAVAHLGAGPGPGVAPSFLSPAEFSEARVVVRWLDRGEGDLRVIYTGGTWALPAAMRPRDRFAVRKPAPAKEQGGP